MKDIYELLNDANVDDNEFEEMAVTESEKTKVKSVLKKAITKKKRVSWKMKSLAVAMTVGLSVTTLGLAFPASAGNIPIIGDIFRFLDNEKTGLYDNYKEYSTAMNMSQESRGIKVTINDAIFDGKTVAITYSIESEKDLGDDITTFGSPDIKGAKGMAGSSKISKVDDYHYVGLYRATPIDLAPIGKESVDIKWNLDSFIRPDTTEKVKGNWKFTFSLNATDSRVQLSNQSTEQNGVTVAIEKVSFTPMSFIVYYNQEVSKKVSDKWHGVDAELEIKDDLGNIYLGVNNGGSGKDSYNMSRSNTFEKLDPNASKLIITPRIRSYDSTNSGGVEFTKNGPKEILKPVKSGVGNEEFVMEDIVIELEK
ncbi:DUF4179 domain-containing protein [Sporosarcina sp. ANT_H38]|uniref:DUF4179 domain-containing protein n=1 Tax=Sporosarcina sp. ANT_H38 TaxID=2597358 RepID=UPI0011F289F8|nr:DUF4179 domain-containing protein [Sporosarcina sp. ANT_H38]KAA0955915.1 DUF4179 domain-containing protein [Sporosarcina sp. ANT_H38]